MIKEKLKEIVAQKTSKNNKKNIENLIAFLVLLIITVVSINYIWGNNETTEQNEINKSSNYKVLAKNDNLENNIEPVKEKNLEEDLENILSKISGVGKVQVLITYSQTSEVIAMSNDVTNISKTEETDANRRNKNNRIDK